MLTFVTGPISGGADEPNSRLEVEDNDFEQTKVDLDEHHIIPLSAKTASFPPQRSRERI